MFDAIQPVTPESIRAAIEASNAERSAIGIPPHQPHGSPLARLDDLRREERCGVDAVAEAISLSLYAKHCDEIKDRAVRNRIEGAARRAIRSPQGAWMALALRRAHVALDTVMAHEMGPLYRMQAPEARQSQARIAVQVVIAALIGALELENPFEGAEGLAVYDAAAAAAKEVK